MSKIILGIDPGQEGAISIIDEIGHLYQIIDMPLHKRHTKGEEVDAIELGKIFFHLKKRFEIIVPIIERVWSTKQMGVTSAFNFGGSLRVIEGSLGCLYWSSGGAVKNPVWVTPQKWKKYHGLIGGTKKDSLAKVRSLYPNEDYFFKRAKDHNRADATLIGLYGLSILKEWE